MKRVHETMSLDLDREQILVAPFGSPKVDLQLFVVNITPVGWTKVKHKKGKNGRIEDNFKGH